MTTILLVLSIVLVFAVLLAAFRVTNLLDLVNKKDDKSSNESPANARQGLFLVLFFVVGIIAFFIFSIQDFGKYHFDVTSVHGVATDKLFWVTMAIIVFVFVVTHIFLFGFAWKYNFKNSRTAHYYPHNDKLEIIWTIVPAIVLAVLIISGLKQWNQITGEAPEGAEVVQIMGYQYAWAFRYPGKDKQLGDRDYRKIDAVNVMGMKMDDQRNFDDFFSTELVIPKGKPVLLKIFGRDVIHSVYNPHFRIQMNAVPGMPTRFWFVPTVSTAEMREKTGNEKFNYELVCNKICGKLHFGMRGIITVLEPDEYNKWYKEQQENTFLKANPSYMSQVPDELEEVAKIASGIDGTQEDKLNNSLTVSASR